MYLHSSNILAYTLVIYCLYSMCTNLLEYFQHSMSAVLAYTQWALYLPILNEYCTCINSMSTVLAYTQWVLYLPILNEYCTCLYSISTVLAYTQWVLYLHILSEYCFNLSILPEYCICLHCMLWGLYCIYSLSTLFAYTLWGLYLHTLWVLYWHILWVLYLSTPSGCHNCQHSLSTVLAYTPVTYLPILSEYCTCLHSSDILAYTLWVLYLTTLQWHTCLYSLSTVLAYTTVLYLDFLFNKCWNDSIASYFSFAFTLGETCSKLLGLKQCPYMFISQAGIYDHRCSH